MRLLTHLWNPKLAPKLADPEGGGRTRREVKNCDSQTKKNNQISVFQHERCMHYTC